jgi:hypothetical protein
MGNWLNQLCVLVDEICGLMNAYFHMDNVIEASSVKATDDDFDCTHAPKVLSK